MRHLGLSVAKNNWKLFSQQSVLKVFVIIGFLMIFEIFLYTLLMDGFAFLKEQGGAGAFLINRLFGLFFLGIGIMLVMSSAVSSYATLYRADEVHFLMVRPLSHSQITMFQFFQAMKLSSWAFFFVMVPFVLSYSNHNNHGLMFVVWSFIFCLPMIVISCGLGTLFTMILVRIIPRNMMIHLITLLALMALGYTVFYWHANKPDASSSSFMISQFVPGLSLSINPLMPSWWVTRGITAMKDQEWLTGVQYLGLLMSNALMLCMILEGVSRWIYYPAYLKVGQVTSVTRRSPKLLSGLESCLFFLRHDVRALIMKDIRTFLRDPMQWSQALIFFGLLGLYFANLGSFNYDQQELTWRNMISFLNVFSMSAVMCSLGARFIYPQLSMEGQGFWILGLSPTTKRTIIVTKFTMALLAMLTVSMTLMLTSTTTLKVTGDIRTITLVMAGAMSFAIAGLSTGLGACYIDIKEKNPARILSGFGGTLNLVLSFGFIVAAVLPLGMIYHLRYIGQLHIHTFNTYRLLAFGWLVILTLLATILPLYFGNRHLNAREY
jgi:ABC-2 type transport system permease protein